LVGALATQVPGAFPAVAGRPAARPGHFADAGLTLLRGTLPGNDASGTELWCRCDGGPHGMAGIAGHAHADALSVEFRVDGVDVLADPGTYCYHGEPAWRSYFRSTLAHNTVEIAGESQSVEGGPFLWNRQARTTVLQVEQAAGATTSAWAAEHDGYQRLAVPARHRRSVRLDAEQGRLEVVDEVGSDSPHRLRMAFHLGPTVTAELVGAEALLSWSTPDGPRSAVLALPPELTWTAHRGEQDPILGWYSPRLGARVPTTTLLGAGRCRSELRLASTLTIASAVAELRTATAADGTFSGSRR
jgi:hypothetical protein